MSRWLLAIAVLSSACRTLLGIDDGVVAGDGGISDGSGSGSGSDGTLCSEASCACTAHDTCDSEVCLASGECADTSTIAYVEQGGAGNTCTQAAPCRTLNAGQATLRPTIKVTGSIVDMSTVTFNIGTFTIYGAPGADVSVMGSGPVIALGPIVELSIYDLDVHGAFTGTDPHGIFIDAGNSTTLRVIRCRIFDNEGAGISAEGGTFVIDRTILANNGVVGVKIDSGMYTITNSIIVGNGNPTVAAGGANLDPVGGPGAASRFELNTVADNLSVLVTGQPVNIACPVDANIDNSLLANGGVSGNCRPHYSRLDTASGNNFTGPPAFIQTDDMNAPGFYRIGPGSMAIDRGTPSNVLVDIDNQARPNGTVIDVGADEYVP